MTAARAAATSAERPAAKNRLERPGDPVTSTPPAPLRRAPVVTSRTPVTPLPIAASVSATSGA